MPDNLSTEYINSVDYDTLKLKLIELKDIQEDAKLKTLAARKLRFEDIDIEAEREGGRLQPDELYTPVHMIDTNIRREQSSYVQYVTQSSRAVITQNDDDPTVEMSLLDRDLTKKVRFDGWQLPMFSNIDGFQSTGYGMMEVVMDMNNPGELGYEFVQNGDFAFITDTKDIQAVEMTARNYHYTRTRLKELCGDGTDDGNNWDKNQVDKILSKEPDSANIEGNDSKDKSLYRVFKIMFRVNGVVHVAWACPDTCDNWVRKPRPLFIGRRKLLQPEPTGIDRLKGVLGIQPKQLNEQELMQQALQMLGQNQLPPSQEDYETSFPYTVYPYLISEDDTITNLKGRIYLDQDIQEAVSSLLSSTVTQARRAAGLYFSKDVSDPNDDLMMQKNIFFKSGCLINSKVTQFQLAPPDPSMFSAIQTLVSTNQNETSQVNFAAMNRKDSRKTAKEVTVAEKQEQILSTVQVVLFSIALTQMYRLMVQVIKSRVLSGYIKVSPTLLPFYAMDFTVKPSGDTDVIEKQELVSKMTQAWPTVQNTPVATLFMCDLIELMFPDRAAKYVQILQQADEQKNSQQQQQMNQMMQMAKQLADKAVQLSKQKEMFSEIGKVNALPQIEQIAEQIEQFYKQMGVQKQ